MLSFCPKTVQISHNYIYIPSLLNLPPFPASHLSRSSQNIKLVSLCYTATSHQLSTLYLTVYMHNYAFKWFQWFPLQSISQGFFCAYLGSTESTKDSYHKSSLLIPVYILQQIMNGILIFFSVITIQYNFLSVNLPRN